MTLRTTTLAAIACILLARGAAGDLQESPHRQSRRVMGTLCEIQVYDSDAGRAARVMTAALDEMSRVDALLSNYLPDSELTRMNKAAGTGAFIASPELYAFVKQSRAFFDETLGTFDPTMGSIVRAWGFFTSQPARPSAADLAKARAAAGFANVALDDATRSVRYAADGLEFDPGGIGKGYAADQAAGVLRGLGIGSALISAGGSTLYAIGHPPGRSGWNVSVRDPAKVAESLAFVTLRDNALSTSGVAEKIVVEDGHRYAHIIDPRTKEPSERMCQVTVVAPDATSSDALTKAAFLLSREQLSRLFGGRRGVHVLRVEDTCGGPVWTTAWSTSIFSRQ